MSLLSFSHYLKERYSSSVVINKNFSTLIDAFCSVLLHLYALNQNGTLFFFVIIELQSAIEHDWVVFLSYLVRLWQVCIRIVFSVKLDLRQDTSTKGERRFNRLIEAVLIQDRQHSWKCQINEVCMSVWLFEICT